MSGFEGLRLPDSAPEAQDSKTMNALRRADRNVNRMIADPTKFRLEQSKQSWQLFGLAQRSMSALPTNFSKTRNPLEVKEIEKILTRLQEIKDIKKGDTLSTAAKDYVYIMETKDQQNKAIESMSFVKVNIQKVTDDIKLLQTAKTGLFPESAAQLNAMIRALDMLRASDPHGAAQWLAGNARANTPTNEALAYAGKLGGVVILGGATALSGIMSIATKQVSAAPLIYGGAMMYILNPDFLTGKNRNQIMESASLLNNDRFVYTLAPKYGMQGKEWGTAIETLFGLYAKNNKTLLAYQANPTSRETMKNLADELVPSSGSLAHKNVMRLLQNKADFDDVLNMMKPITSKETIQLVAGYIKGGSWRYARKVDANGFARTQNPEAFPGLKVPNQPS